MTCATCEGQGKLTRYLPVHKGDEYIDEDGETKIRSHDDWVYRKISCSDCKGKGFLTPEEAGLDKF